MILAEEFLLLAIDGTTGKKRVGGDLLEPALGGALLAELALRERIGVTPDSEGWSKRGRITSTNTEPTDDPELDRALAELTDREGAKVKNLISPMSGKRLTKGLSERLLERLARAGTVSKERGEVL